MDLLRGEHGVHLDRVREDKRVAGDRFVRKLCDQHQRCRDAVVFDRLARHVGVVGKRGLRGVGSVAGELGAVEGDELGQASEPFREACAKRGGAICPRAVVEQAQVEALRNRERVEPARQVSGEGPRPFVRG